MKILCVTDSLGSGGAQRQLVELALGFKENDHNVSFLTYFYDPFYNPILNKAGIENNCIQESNYLLRFLKMRHFIRKGKYDAVLSFLEAANFICELAGFPFRKWKLVVGERNANPAIKRSVKLKTYRWFHLLADFVVANSHANMSMVQSINPFLHKSKCLVIYNAVDLNRWKPSSEYSPRKNGKFRLIIAANHRPQKNLDGLLDALSLFTESERSGLKVEWYGDPVNESMLKAMEKIKDYHLENVISFFPATRDITTKIQEADVAGLFSFYEGFPNSLCEGMACGKPIICSLVSDMPVILSNNQNVLCDPHNINSIKKVIGFVLRLNDEELAQLGNQNRLFAEKNFDSENIVSQYLKLME